MDFKEKLVEVLKKCGVCNAYAVVQLANALAENGVTIQEWISVEDRLPNEMGTYLVCTNKGGIVMAHWYGDKFGGGYASKKVTHWMPIPQPPKGE